eukprot:CAMPEP_0195521000 /NCGR_PEP_ID=MMETSP0794_2-20130614/17758_1 /TAXON_ID=515487 /ORGANISM="Stephanopyxis turris, Strain CCMP 815" /LENGTH=222 /DNA_ID=CAMNT_0040650453 /DNA_START=53 /DNA_END=721 /DNA_ORIENTATION=+
MLRCALLLLSLAASASAAAFVPSIVGSLKVHAPSQLNMAKEIEFEAQDGSKVRVGIIKTRWNSEHVTNIVDGAKLALKECNVTDENIFETEVPGAYELPLAARFLALSGTVDAVICCGVLIKGDTMHFEYICDAVSSGIMQVGLSTSTPIIFGVLTCLNEEQVIARSTGDNNHGEGWGKTAVEMALLKTAALGSKKKMGSMGFGTTQEIDTKGGEKKSVGFF